MASELSSRSFRDLPWYKAGVPGQENEIFSFNGSSDGRLEEFVLLILKKVGGQHAGKGALVRARAGKTSPAIST